VTFLGHIDYEELPTIYSRARCLVLPSMVEQWGLVVNEAVAAGLPVLLSDRCGAAADLLVEGENGYSFNPERQSEMVDCLRRIASMRDIASLRAVSLEKAAEWDLDRFGSGLKWCIDIALKRPTRVRISSRLTVQSAWLMAR
jgi:glycosyltransferase involved in cell wall biosynthesis